MKDSVYLVIGLIALIIAILVAAPWLLLWAIGQLFNYHIQFTFWNWLAAIILLVLGTGGHSSS